MKESFLDRAKADGQVFVKTVSLLSKLSKLKVEIAKKQKERKHLLGVIGGAVFDVYKRSDTDDGSVILESVGSHFDSLRRLDAELSKLEAEVQHVKSSFKSTGQTPPQANTETSGD